MTTPSQTVGPFFSFSLCERAAAELAPRNAQDTLTLHGRVLDGEGAGVDDALVEVWHPDVGFGRCGADRDGRFEFVLPAATRQLNVTVFARGLLRHVTTRVYFPGEESAVPQVVPDERRSTLLAQPDGDRTLRFDVHLQGERETVFFDV